MKTYKLWNKKDKINGVEPSYFLNQVPFKDYNGDIILVIVDNKITQVESKQVLSQVYDIDINLPLNEFSKVYEQKLEEIRIQMEKEEKERQAKIKE